jgi:hypothetical protein
MQHVRDGNGLLKFVQGTGPAHVRCIFALTRERRLVIQARARVQITEAA